MAVVERSTRIYEGSRIPSPIPTVLQIDTDRHKLEDILRINFGPNHPSTHGVLRLVVDLDGELVAGIAAVIGYLHTGFEKTMDAEIAPGFRWIEVAPAGARVSIAIISAEGGASGIDTGIRFTTPDAAAEHAAMRERGIEVDDLLEMPGVPPMFTFRDGDGNTLYVVES